MIGKKMLDALNEQVNAEMYSGYLYLAMAAYFEDANLPGMAKWMTVQAQEELGHAMKIYRFIVERNGRASFKAIAAPPAKWDSPLAAFQAAYDHERKVTGLIDDLVNLAAAQKDHASGVFLQWFVNEQVEEEATALAIVAKLKMIGDKPHGLLMLDHELGKREAGGD